MIDWAKAKLDFRNSVLNTPNKEAFWDYHNPNIEKLIKEVGTDPEVLGNQMYMRDPGETEARLQETLLRHLKFNDMTPKYKTRTYSPRESTDRFKDAGLALDTNYGAAYRPNEYKLRKWKTTEEVDPNTLSPELRNVWDYMPNSNNYGTLPLGQHDWLKTGKLYPWKFEDYPRDLQHDYSNFR